MFWLVWLAAGAICALLTISWISQRPTSQQIPLLAFSLFIAALIYIFFAFYMDAREWMCAELIGVAIYGAFALLGWRHSYLWVGIGWLLHVGWDIGLHLFGPAHDAVPAWYAIACLSFDIVIALFIFRKGPKLQPSD